MRSRSSSPGLRCAGPALPSTWTCPRYARDRTAYRHVRAPLVPREGSQRRSGSPGGRLGRTGTHPETLSQTAEALTLDTTHPPGLLRRPCRGQGATVALAGTGPVVLAPHRCRRVHLRRGTPGPRASLWGAPFPIVPFGRSTARFCAFVGWVVSPGGGWHLLDAEASVRWEVTFWVGCRCILAGFGGGQCGRSLVSRLTDRHFAGLLGVRSAIAVFERTGEREARSVGATHAQHHVLLALRGRGDDEGRRR